MREQREPWITLPAKETGGGRSLPLDPRFRTHAVATRRPNPPPAEPLPHTPDRSSREPEEPEFLLSGPGARAVPTPVAIERAAAAAAISRPSSPRRVEPPVPMEPPRPAPAETHAPRAPEVGLDDLPAVSSADWVGKVGEAAKMVDVVVVFYTAAYLGSEQFAFAFRTVVNEVLPQLGRPYTAYRFCLDDEPDFVTEMAESLGLPQDNPVTVAGFAWCGPGRRLFLLGDRALGSPAMFQRSLRRSLMGQPPPSMGEGDTRRRAVAGAPRPRVRILGGRVLAILAWCLFGTAALGAAVVGVAPQWASALLHATALPDPAAARKDLPGSSDAQTHATPPVAASLGNPIAASAAGGAQAPQASVSPAKSTQAHIRKKRSASALTANPAYWGLPEDRSR